MYSLSTHESLKKADFCQIDKDFEGRKRYDERKFVYHPLGMIQAAKESLSAPSANSQRPALATSAGGQSSLGESDTRAPSAGSATQPATTGAVR